MKELKSNTPSAPHTGELLTRKDLCLILGVSESTLKNWDTKGIGVPIVKVGRRVRYRRADVIEFIQSRVENYGEVLS